MLTAELLVAPSPAFAHGLVGRADLPIPRWLFVWAAGVVLVVSFAALAALWPEPRLEHTRLRRLGRIPPVVELIAGALGVAVFAVVVYSGLAGNQTANLNLGPTFIYVVFWVGLAVASLLFGDLFRVLSPWRATARAAAWSLGRISRRRLRAPFAYPGRLGYWPAVAGIAGFVWLELVYVNKGDPSTLALLSLAYAAAQLAGMGAYGIETWSQRGDGFGVYFGLFARLSPWERRDGVLYLRPPLSGVTALPLLPGTVALLCVAIGSTAFDGFSQSAAWPAAAQGLNESFAWLGFGKDASFQLATTVGLAAAILAVATFYRLGIYGMRTVGGAPAGERLAGRFAHTLVPIALAYAVAHYFSLLAFQGQAAVALASDPLADGSDFLGTANLAIDYGLISATGVWYVQVGALVAGHVAGLTLAHDRALLIYGKARQSLRSQYWMLAIMIGFTSLGLWLLSAINP